MNADELRKLQLLELKILLEIKRICDKHEIKFILIGGSLLGAIRHGGFIPWDDDIDIGMNRNDFNRFCSIAQAELSDEYILDTKVLYNRCNCIIKIRLKNTHIIEYNDVRIPEFDGIFVDIFPFDVLPDSNLFGYFYYYWFNFVLRGYWIRSKYWFPNSFIGKINAITSYLLTLIIPKKRLKTFLDNYCQKYNDSETKRIVLLLSPKIKSHKYNATILTKTKQHSFEGIMFHIPEEHDLYLTIHYGDYMKLPPEKSRINEHIKKIDFGQYS